MKLPSRHSSSSSITERRPLQIEDGDSRNLVSQISFHDTTIDDPAEKNKEGDYGLITIISSQQQRMYLSTIFWIGFGLVGWYFPRHLIDKETTIITKQPPYQIIGDNIILDFQLNEPLVDPATVDSFLLKSTSIYLPLIFLILHARYGSPPISISFDGSIPNNTIIPKFYFVATVISSFCMAIGLSEGTTVLVKLWVQRRRPNFYALCGFDSTLKQCTADINHIRESNFSFPSGHSSLVCCGMTFVIWYLHGHYEALLRQRSTTTTTSSTTYTSSRPISLLIVTCLCWGWTLFVAASRLVDHWHHPSDILAGLCLGFTTCTFAYHHWYPPIWSSGAGIPRGFLSSMSTTTTTSSTLNKVVNSETETFV